MTVKETIESIRKSLTGDTKKDIFTLYQAIRIYSEDPNFPAIRRQINALIDDLLADVSEEEQIKIAKYVQEQTFYAYMDKIKKIRRTISKQDYDKALQLCNEQEKELRYYMEEAKKENSSAINFRIYQDQGEYTLGAAYYPVKNEVNFPFDIISLFLIKIQVLYLMGRKQEALSLIHDTYEFNPVKVSITLLEADIQRKEANEYSYKSCVKKAHRFIFTEMDFLSYFDYVGGFFVEFRKNQKIGNALGKLSNERHYKDALKKLTPEMQIAMKAEGFSYRLSDEVYAAFILRAKDCLLKKQRAIYTYLYSHLLSFVGPEQLQEEGLADPDTAFIESPKQKPASRRTKKATVSPEAGERKE